MIEYKIKASMLVFSLLVTLTGSVITLEDWAQLNVEQQIAIVEFEELGENQKQGFSVERFVSFAAFNQSMHRSVEKLKLEFAKE